MVQGGHQHRVAEDSKRNGWKPGQHIADESDRVADAVTSVLREKDANQRAERDGKQRTDADDLERADDGVEDTSTGHADRVRRTREEPWRQHPWQTLDQDEEQEDQDRDRGEHDRKND